MECYIPLRLIIFDESKKGVADVKSRPESGRSLSASVANPICTTFGKSAVFRLRYQSSCFSCLEMIGCHLKLWVKVMEGHELK